MSSRAFVIAGTDTGIGKTVFSAMLTLALDGCYWKPVQSGAEEGTDTETVKRMTGLPADRFFPERYVLRRPLSPHRAAELDGKAISREILQTLPVCAKPLVIELAGGLMVPLTRSLLQINVLEDWRIPVVLIARTELGTINHTLLSCEALQARSIPLLGVAFVGDANEDSERTIVELAKTRRLGRLPRLKNLTTAALKRAFADAFSLRDFTVPVEEALR